MVGYQDWIEKEYLVTNLYLDPLNPRLPEADKKLSQKELIEELIKYEDVYEIAKGIAEDGYYPVELLICIREDDKKCIVEGNRRLAALKLLLSPESAPENEQSKYRKLAKSISMDQIKKVKVTIAPDRKSANHYINNKHTSPTIKPWKPIQKAKFYKNMLSTGSSISEISNEFNISQSEINESLQLLDMYNIACVLDLQTDVKETVFDSRKFPVSTLQRAFQNKRIQKFLGIGFDSNKKMLGRIKKEEFIKGYSKIINDIVSGKLDSRKINKEEDVKKYLNHIKEYKPNIKEKGKFYIHDLIEGEEKPKTTKKAKSSKTQKTRKNSPLISSEFKCTVDDERIRSVFKELRKLKVEDYINSVSILLRLLLELSLAHYLDVTGKIKDVRNLLKAKNPRKNYHKNYYPTLSEILNYIVHEDTNVNYSNTQARRALMHLVSGNDTIYSKDLLDLYVHNKFVMPSEPQLRTFWKQLSPIFTVTLKEPIVED